MMQHASSLGNATVIHRSTPSRLTSCARFQTARSDRERFHSFNSDDGSAGSRTPVLSDDRGFITPLESSGRSARSTGHGRLINVRYSEPSQAGTALSAAQTGMMNRPRAIPARKLDMTVFDEDRHTPSRAVRALRGQFASLSTTQVNEASSSAQHPLDETIGSEYSANTAHEVELAKAVEAPKSQTASQVTLLRYNPSGTSKVNTRPSSPRPNITGTALDEPTGSPKYSATSTKKSWIPGGAFSMQSLKEWWPRSQVGTDQQSQNGVSVQSGSSVQSGKSKASAFIGRVKRFGRMGNIRDTTVRKTAAMEDFIKSGREMYEGT